MNEIFITLVALQLKHVLADYFLQTDYMVLNKGKYGHLGGILHAASHAAFSFVILSLAGVGILTALIIAAIELLVHYHIDWSKEAIGKHYRLSPDMIAFWKLHGADQALHQMTYVLIIYWLVSQNQLGA